MNAPSVGPLFLEAADDAIPLNVRGSAGVGLQLTGTWSGTVSFEALVDGEANTWVAFNMVPSNSATAASTATGNGAWSANCAGYEAVRARFSTATSGTVRALLLATEGAGRY